MPCVIHIICRERGSLYIFLGREIWTMARPEFRPFSCSPFATFSTVNNIRLHVQDVKYLTVRMLARRESHPTESMRNFIEYMLIYAVFLYDFYCPFNNLLIGHRGLQLLMQSYRRRRETDWGVVWGEHAEWCASQEKLSHKNAIGAIFFWRSWSLSQQTDTH